MRKTLAIMISGFLAAGMAGCVIHLENGGHRHPDECYDCHSSWELDRWRLDVTCIEFEITITTDGYWYKPVGAADSLKQFHLLKVNDGGTVIGPTTPS